MRRVMIKNEKTGEKRLVKVSVGIKLTLQPKYTALLNNQQVSRREFKQTAILADKACTLFSW